MEGKFLVWLLLLGLRAPGQDNTTTTDVSVKLYVSVGHADLTHKKGKAPPGVGTAGTSSDSGKYVYDKFTRTKGLTGNLDYVAAQDAHVGWELVSDDGHTITWRKLASGAGTQPTDTAPKQSSGTAALTITGKANLSKPDYIINITDVLSSKPTLSGDPGESDVALQELKKELCNLTKALLEIRTVKLEKDEVGELLTNPQARITRDLPFKFFGADKVLPVVISRKLEISGELGDSKTYERATCSP